MILILVDGKVSKTAGKQGCSGLASRTKHQNNNGHFPSPPCSEQEHGIQ